VKFFHVLRYIVGTESVYFSIIVHGYFGILLISENDHFVTPGEKVAVLVHHGKGNEMLFLMMIC
jgi:hypothetical protein